MLEMMHYLDYHDFDNTKFTELFGRQKGSILQKILFQIIRLSVQSIPATMNMRLYKFPSR